MTRSAMLLNMQAAVLVLPCNPEEQIVYLALYDRALAVGADGTVVWDVATGLTLGPDPLEQTVLGVNYLPTLDAIVAATIDGFIYVLDRATGGQLLGAPFSLPGEKSPDIPSTVPQPVMDAAEDAWQLLVNRPDGKFQDFTNVLLGEDVEVGNMFSVDLMTGRLWVAATAPDGEDGTVDGLSELGALYGLDVVPDGGGYQILEVCHASFEGGTGSTQRSGLTVRESTLVTT